jgi:hypothetical protein
VIQPNRLYEVKPQKEIVMTGEVYHVRLSWQSSATTKAQLYSLSTWADRLVPAIERCTA